LAEAALRLRMNDVRGAAGARETQVAAGASAAITAALCR